MDSLKEPNVRAEDWSDLPAALMKLIVECRVTNSPRASNHVCDLTPRDTVNIELRL